MNCVCRLSLLSLVYVLCFIIGIRPVRLAFQRYATPHRVEAATSLQAWQRQKLAQAQAQRHRLRITSALQLQRTARYFLARRRARTLRATRDQVRWLQDPPASFSLFRIFA